MSVFTVCEEVQGAGEISPWRFVYRSLEDVRTAIQEALKECYLDDVDDAGDLVWQAIWADRQECVPDENGWTHAKIYTDDDVCYHITRCEYEQNETPRRQG